MGITTELAVDLFQIQTLTDNDIEQIHTLIIDYFAATFAGYKLNRSFNSAVEKVVYSQEGVEESYIFLQSRKYPASRAAFMNSVYGHGAELDDGNKKAAGHCGVHVIPAVFALADKLGSKRDDVLVAIATGYEAYIRISSAAQPGLIQRGFHSTGMAGTLACAAACARLYQMDAQGIEDSIAISTTLSGGLLSYGDSRPAIKPLNPGKAAENGVFAAMLVNEGVKGPIEALEGPNGWFRAVTDKVDKDMLKGTDHLLLHECYFKLYPSCRHTHCVIDAAVDLHQKVAVKDIKKVKVHIYPNAIKLAGQICFPNDKDEAKFSICYTLACALMYGSYGISNMDPPNLSEEIVSLIRKTELIPDETMENRKKNIRGARIEIVKTNGEILNKTVLVPRGDPENSLTRNDIIDKLYICSQGQVEETVIKSLIKVITEIKGDEPFVNPMSILY